MVESRDYLLSHNPIQLIEVQASIGRGLNRALDRDQHDIVMPLPVGIIALPEYSQIFFWREMIRVQPVRRAESISPRDARLCHHRLSSDPSQIEKPGPAAVFGQPWLHS
jgi:hypothetical protein